MNPINLNQTESLWVKCQIKSGNLYERPALTLNHISKLSIPFRSDSDTMFKTVLSLSSQQLWELTDCRCKQMKGWDGRVWQSNNRGLVYLCLSRLGQVNCTYFTVSIHADRQQVVLGAVTIWGKTERGRVSEEVKLGLWYTNASFHLVHNAPDSSIWR